MVVRLEGKIDGNHVIFQHKDGDVWESTIPPPPIYMEFMWLN